MEKPIITISEGKIQGIKLKSVTGKEYLAFRGIPYAQPPIGDLRFRVIFRKTRVKSQVVNFHTEFYRNLSPLLNGPEYEMLQISVVPYQPNWKLLENRHSMFWAVKIVFT